MITVKVKNLKPHTANARKRQYPDPRVIVMVRGEELIIEGYNGAQATLKRHKRTVYFLGTGHAPNWTRARWGNALEISEDIEHFESTGELPRSKSPGWA